MLARNLSRLKGVFQDTQEHKVSKKQRRRKALIRASYRILPILRNLLFIAGYVWMILLPLPHIGQGIYIDENALQPGQVETYWSWSDVYRADRYLETLEQLRDRNASSIEKATFLKSEFVKLGLPAATQDFYFKAGTMRIEGTNTYAILSAPRTSGTEAMVLAASWVSVNTETNMRGIATVLSLAGYLRKYSLWAKDIVFVIGDGHLEGIQAWLSAYHGREQSNLVAQPLTLHSGVIWTALAIDYPGHSFSHIGIFFEGLNGRLPNQDLMNSFNIISAHTGGVPVLLYDHIEDETHERVPTWMSQLVRSHVSVRDYAARARNIIRHVRYQVFGRPSGIHGLFHQYRIDAITLFAVPASGPHGFHSLGRIIESTLRTMNNLLERLHASFFFYVLTGPGTFLKIGQYIPSSVIISVAMMLGGLRMWVDARWRESAKTDRSKGAHSESPPDLETRRRRVLPPLVVMLSTHALGASFFSIVTSPWFAARLGPTTSYLPIIPLSLIVFSILSAFQTPETSSTSLRREPSPAPLWMLLKAFNLCLASTVISVISVLNFSFGAVLAVFLGIPLSISSPSRTLSSKVIKSMAYHILLVPVWLIFLIHPTSQPIWDWQVLGAWFAPFICTVYLPLVLQAMIVCMLNP